MSFIQWFIELPFSVIVVFQIGQGALLWYAFMGDTPRARRPVSVKDVYKS